MNRRSIAAYLLSAGLIVGSGAVTVAATASGKTVKHPATTRPAAKPRVDVVTEYRDVTVTDPAPATTAAETRHDGASGSHAETSEPAEPTTLAPPASVPAPPTTDGSHEAHGPETEGPETETHGPETEGPETEMHGHEAHGPETEAPETPESSDGHRGGDD